MLMGTIKTLMVGTPNAMALATPDAARQNSSKAKHRAKEAYAGHILTHETEGEQHSQIL